MDKVYIGIIVVLTIVCVGMFIDNTRLEARAANLTTDLVVSRTNEITVRKEVEVQNEAITKLAVDKAERDREYTELLSKPDRVRYEYVYSKIPTIGVKSNECNDIKKLIDDIRTAGY